MQQARDGNTTSYCSPSIWRVFIDGKLFISNDHRTCFDTKEQAETALLTSDWMKTIEEYVDYSQEFFGKVGDGEWRVCFLEKIFNKSNIKYKEYICNE